MNKIAFLYGAETRRLKKIIHKTHDKDLCRRATAVLLVLNVRLKLKSPDCCKNVARNSIELKQIFILSARNLFST